MTLLRMSRKMLNCVLSASSFNTGKFTRIDDTPLYEGGSQYLHHTPCVNQCAPQITRRCPLLLARHPPAGLQ